MRTIFIARFSRGRARIALTFTACTLALGAAAPAAQAAFTLTPCTGTTITGRGATFQAAAQGGFTANFFTNSSGACGANAKAIDYNAAGSGNGRRSFGERSGTNTTGARDAAIRFAGTDEAPTSTQEQQIEGGPIAGGVDVTSADDGVLHVIPVAIGANAIDVNYPNGCTIPDAALANTRSTDGTDRIKLTAAQIEAAFAADSSVDTWGELVPGITGTATDPAFPASTSCANVPVRRVVRRDSSGTTFILKDYFHKINNTRGWKTLANQAWPSPVPSPGGTEATSCPVASNLCKNTSDGNGPLLDLLNLTDGAIGYADVATSRLKGYQSTPSTATTPDTTFWVPIVNTAAAQFEPTSAVDSYKSGTPGANCANVAFTGVPTTTLGSFATANGSGNASAAFYPLCGLTYILAWDDYAPVYGATACEESKARTVKDYLTSIVSTAGQATLGPRDYTELPSGAGSLREIASTGVNAINWNKAGGSVAATPCSTPPLPGPGPDPGPGPGPGPGTQPPSNSFTIPSVKTTSKKSGARFKLKVQLPGGGKLSAKATSSYKVKGKTKKVTLGSVSGTATSAGAISVTIKVGSAGRRALRKAKKLKVKIAVKFTPSGGTSKTVNKTVTLKRAKK